MVKSGWFLALALASATFPAAAQTGPEAQALDLIKRSIAFRTVEGSGNQTFEYATYLKSLLVQAGFPEADIEVQKLGDTAWLAARYRGTGKAANGAKPLLISAHMDVVEAKREDWERDPFTPVVENGYIYGRGATDMKFDLSLVVITLIELRKSGFKPGRDIVLVASGDEESSMKTTAALAAKFGNAGLLLNADGGGGTLGEDGKPRVYGIQGAEKTYQDFQLSIMDPGGHSSAPRRTNAIVELARVLDRIGAYEFPGQINEITRASLLSSAKTAPAPLADAMRRFVADPTDKAALKTLRDDPSYVGQTGTTCVATMVNGGHAINALPQRATANINCRIFPGVTIESVQAKLLEVAGNPRLTITVIDGGTVPSDASPLRPDVVGAVTHAVHARYPGIDVTPNMASGATDSMHFRARGIPSYGTSSIFMKNSDDFSHGLNERTPVANIAPGLKHWRSLLAELAK